MLHDSTGRVHVAVQVVPPFESTLAYRTDVRPLVLDEDPMPQEMWLVHHS